ncbi:MAG: Imm1 family immunity protein [Burkholderiales bacterium]
MTGTPEAQLSQAVDLAFPAEQRERARGLLADYGSGASDAEPERVRAAMLRLCKGDIARLETLVANARVDYRDILYWDETANTAAPPGGEADGDDEEWEDDTIRDSDALARALDVGRPNFLELVTGDPDGEHTVTLINGELGWMMHVALDDDATWHSIDPDYGGPADAQIEYLVDGYHLDKFPAAWALPVAELKRALEHFLEHGERAPWVRWVEDT